MDQVLARKSGAATTQSRSHRRLAKFVDWIKAEPGTREAIYKQAGDIRRLISSRQRRQRFGGAHENGVDGKQLRGVLRPDQFAVLPGRLVKAVSIAELRVQFPHSIPN